jgi:hypothetical protein
VISLSIIVPTLDIRRCTPLFQSLGQVDLSCCELIIIDQDPTAGNELPEDVATSIPAIKTHHLPAGRMPAPAARNMGAEVAKGRWLIFLDDDAIVLAGSTIFDEANRLDLGPGLHVTNRGYLDGDEFVSHWPGLGPVNHKNFSRYIIEWNFFIERSLFEDLGMFPQLGPGSPHLAQCGEAFALVGKAISRDVDIVLHPVDRIAHPRLDIDPKTEKRAGYEYGAGYAVSVGTREFSVKRRMYWLIRTIAAVLRLATPLTPWAIRAARYRFLGLCDGLLKRPPRATAPMKQRTGRTI